MPVFMKKTKELEAQTDAFLDAISEAAITFKKGISSYLYNEDSEFRKRIQQVSDYERKADDLRMEIETSLYENTLIPESRGDVLALLESIDNVVDKMKETIIYFSIENPLIEDEFTPLFEKVAEASVKSVECLVLAVRAFFKDIRSVNNHIHKVHYYEKEADSLSEELKRAIFASEYDLAQKLHLSNFASSVEKVSDYAESVSDRLTIFVIKRRI
jgi:uncharacterized protein